MGGELGRNRVPVARRRGSRAGARARAAVRVARTRTDVDPLDSGPSSCGRRRGPRRPAPRGPIRPAARPRDAARPDRAPDPLAAGRESAPGAERGDRKGRRGRPGGAACAAPRRVADTGRDSDGTRSGNRWRRLFVPLRAGGLLAGDVWSARHALAWPHAVRSIGATVAFRRMGSPLAQRRKQWKQILSRFARGLSCATLLVCVACRLRCWPMDR